MLNEEGQGDFVLLFAIDWPLVDISEFMYSTGKKKRIAGLVDGIRQGCVNNILLLPFKCMNISLRTLFPPIFTFLKYILYAGDDDGTIPIPRSNLNGQLDDIVDRADGSDVSFSRDVPCTPPVLAARSPVFKMELLGSMAESTMPCVTLQNIDPATFKALLHFVYMDTLPSPTEAVRIGEVEADVCTEAVGERVGGDGGDDSRLRAYAERYHCPELKSKCLSFLMAEINFTKVAVTDGYFHLRRDFPLIIEEIKKRIES
uniref:BTB domain-containing protein n=1 Tax=Oryza glumipatula TaxID=40148 RepID=A0A0D9ZBS0_9ORYZ